MRLGFILFSLFLGHLCCLGQSTVNYSPSNVTLANPERGLQKYSITDDSYNTSSNYSNLDSDELIDWRTGSDKVTVLFRYFLLDNFLTTDLSATYLNNIENDFAVIRNAGMKCIVRFSYSNAQSDALQQPSKAQMLTHITQLSALLQENKDVILTHQAGFIGTWGEWYYTNSSEFGTDGAINATQWQNRMDIVDAMLAATPVEIPIQVRYAGIKTTMYGNTPLASDDAYQNTPQARIGFFNDAFLNNWGDQGTYAVNGAAQNPVGTEDYTYMANETMYTPMTGETNGLNAPRTDGANAVFEMDSVNWSTLNRDYFTAIWDNWIAEGYYDQILQQLGYRLVLNASTITTNAPTFTIQLSLDNMGFARPFKQRPVYLVLENTMTNDTIPLLINTDIRTWQDHVSLVQEFPLPAPGLYSLHLWMPDSDSLLSTLPAYSIQLANVDTWDAATGFNNLLQTLDVTTALDEWQAQHALLLFPNPASSEIQFPPMVSDKITLYTATGDVVREAFVVDQSGIDVSDLAPGLYYMHLQGSQQTYKFIKQ